MQVQRGLRAVAVCEGTKGVLVLAVGLGLLGFIHRDLQQIAEDVVRHLHLNPSARFPRVFLMVASRLDGVQLWTVAVGTLVYSGLRFLEAVGLWKDRSWAKWLGAISGGIYIPVEIYEVARKATTMRLVLMTLNAAVVAYLLWNLWQRSRLRVSTHR
jgi:uncharacterized membrane protein (DUF2068 family)